MWLPPGQQVNGMQGALVEINPLYNASGQGQGALVETNPLYNASGSLVTPARKTTEVNPLYSPSQLEQARASAPASIAETRVDGHVPLSVNPMYGAADAPDDAVPRFANPIYSGEGEPTMASTADARAHMASMSSRLVDSTYSNATPTTEASSSAVYSMPALHTAVYAASDSVGTASQATTLLTAGYASPNAGPAPYFSAPLAVDPTDAAGGPPPLTQPYFAAPVARAHGDGHMTIAGAGSQDA
jgi:hypothetical protein